MDLHPRAHYVAPAMELLLILSAMLSAVTGAFAGERGTEARIHQAEAAVGAQSVVAAVGEQAARLAPSRPANVAPLVPVAPLAALAPAAAPPLYGNRLKE